VDAVVLLAVKAHELLSVDLDFGYSSNLVVLYHDGVALEKNLKG